MARSVKSLLKLLDEINTLARNRSKASDGWIGDAAHASGRSDHNPEPDGTVDARDFTHDPAHGADMHVISEHIKDDPRVSYIIWNRRIWNPSISRSWRPYSGSNPHDKHMHVSVLDRLQDDESPWLEEDMTPEQSEKLDAIWKALYKKVDHDDDPETPKKTAEHLNVIEDLLNQILEELRTP